MPLPNRREDESRENFISRCMSDDKISKEYPDKDQKLAVCMSKACQDMSTMAQADFKYNVEELGFTEELNEDNFYIPTEAEYEEVEGEETEDWDVALAKPGLWENIRKKKEREGKNYKPAKTEKEGRPTQDQLKRAQEGCNCKGKAMVAYSVFMYENPKTGEKYTYDRIGNYKKDGQSLVYKGKAAKYKGRTVKLGKPFRTPDGPKKFAVYVKNGSGKVVIVRFGDPNMEIKKDNPARRKSFRARHKCDTNPGPRWKARYWSCRKW
jgi:hypothetical protein